MSLEQRYVHHLRQSARNQPHKYVCVLCSQPIRTAGRESFQSHIDIAHSEEVAKSSKGNPEFDLKLWVDELEVRSRTNGSSNAEFDREDSKTNRETTEKMEGLSLDAKKKSSHRKLVPARNEQRHSIDPGGGSGGQKRPRSSDDQHLRSKGQSKSHNPRRAVPKSEAADLTNQLTRGNTFQSNWGVDGQPTRQLFNPADTSVAATAGQVTLPSRSAAAQSSDLRQQTPSVTATASTQPPQTNQERGVLPMPTTLSSSSSQREGGISMPIDARWPDMLLQPDSRPISQEQLAAEVKSIYAGLTMVESKCIHVDKAQALAMREGDTKISNDHWQALIALHRTLLHEHHDFFLASQHPSASPALRRLASKYSMPARMWKHGIHSFLELLRYRLPESLEFMISFIYTAYQMMSLLYETVPAFKNTWIECLGDLGRYRMAIEDEDVRDRENWANVSRFWYTKAADRSPEVGRLYHHLAILARPNALQQLSLYARSLISVQVFNSARESILTLFNPFTGQSDTPPSHISQLDSFYVKAHALLFAKEQIEEFQQCRDGFLELLDQHISRVAAKWREQGAWVIIALLGALFDYGNDSSLRRVFDLGFQKVEQSVQATQTAPSSTVESQKELSADGDSEMNDLEPTIAVDERTQVAFANALSFTTSIATLVLRRQGDKNVLPFVHILLAFLQALASLRAVDEKIDSAYVVTAILESIPIQELCSFLNTISKSDPVEPRWATGDFIRPEKGEYTPLPEDHLIRGQTWSQGYFPSEMFRSSGSDDEEKNIEHASTVRMRVERVLNLAFRLSKENIGVTFDPTTRAFSCHGKSMPTATTSLSSQTKAPLPNSLVSQDISMPDSPSESASDRDSGFESSEDSPENNMLKRAGPGRTDDQSHDGRLAIPAEQLEDASSILQSEVTYMVCDEQLMLKQQDLFQMLVTRRWKIVVPHKVLYELSNVSKTGDSTAAESARAALQQVQAAFTTTELKILDANGNDITQKHLGSVQTTDIPSCDSDMQDTDDYQEDLMGVARSATQMSLGEKPQPQEGKSRGVRPAMLLSEDRRTRLRAAGQKIAAVAPSVLRRYLESGVSRMRSRSIGSSGRPSESKATSSGADLTPRTPPEPSTDQMEVGQ